MTATPFLFGKLPANGDFVARGLEPAAERVWDDWASGEIEAARAELGVDFGPAHDAAPPWGFVDGPGFLGEGWRCGAVAASVDSAGRRFLLIVGQDGMSEPEAAFAGLAGAMAAQTVIRRILVERLDADAAIDALAEAFSLPEAYSAAPVVQARVSAGAWWAFGDVIPPVASDGPAPTFIVRALSRIAALLKEAA